MDISDRGILKRLLTGYILDIYKYETKFLKRFFPGFQDKTIMDISFTSSIIRIEFYTGTINPTVVLCDFDAVTQWVDNLK